MTLPVGARLDEYEIVEHLADGSEAEVYRALAVTSGASVVVKVPHDAVLNNPILAARWRRELRLTEPLEHERLQCRVDRGNPHSRPYMAVEYAGGGSLRSWVSVDLPIGQVVAWGEQLAEGPGYLHQNGIIHRGLKPENVLVTDDLTVKLGDSGAAVRFRVWLPWAPPEPPEGTADYVSPEGVGGYRGDPRSDVYSWGVLMYELLTGEVPFTGDSPAAIMEARLSAHPRSPREVRPEIPRTLEAVVMTAMRRKPELRYPDMVSVAADLKRLDQLDADQFDLTDEPPSSVAATEMVALIRFVAVIAASVVAVFAIAIALTIALH